MNDKMLLSMDEACRLLGLRKSTLYSLCMRKEIPCVKIGKLNRFRPQALTKWIESHEQGNA